MRHPIKGIVIELAIRGDPLFRRAVAHPAPPAVGLHPLPFSAFVRLFPAQEVLQPSYAFSERARASEKRVADRRRTSSIQAWLRARTAGVWVQHTRHRLYPGVNDLALE
jgi:hypothetical protein